MERPECKKAIVPEKEQENKQDDRLGKDGKDNRLGKDNGLGMKRAYFERAIFFSWACRMEECCKYCYMSTLPKEKRTDERVRSIASLLAETIITRELGWDYGFLSGGIGVYSDDKVLDLLKKTNIILGRKVWINIGILSRDQMSLFSPYIEGIVGTIEVLDPVLHEKICPSKPIAAVERMFEDAERLGIKRGMTLIVGLGESIHDFSLLKTFIEKHKISKIHVYGLNPQKGTIFEKTKPPTIEYQSEWIRLIRQAFPAISMQAGIWVDRVSYVKSLLEAGADSVSKFPAIRYFGSEAAKEIERQAFLANRDFQGTLTRMPAIDWDLLVDDLPFDKRLRDDIKKKLHGYLKIMSRR